MVALEVVEAEARREVRRLISHLERAKRLILIVSSGRGGYQQSYGPPAAVLGSLFAGCSRTVVDTP